MVPRSQNVTSVVVRIEAPSRVRLEDVSQTDALAREVAHVEFEGCAYSPGDPPLPFSFSPPPLDPGRRYEIRAHLDLGNSGEIRSGDQITTESYPVLTYGFPSRVDLRLKQI